MSVTVRNDFAVHLKQKQKRHHKVPYQTAIETNKSESHEDEKIIVVKVKRQLKSKSLRQIIAVPRGPFIFSRVSGTDGRPLP